MKEEIIIPTNDELNERINLLNTMFYQGVNYNMFVSVALNVRNGKTSNLKTGEWNSFDAAGWTVFLNRELKRHQIEFNEEQTKLIFDYFSRFYNSRVIGTSKQNEYKANHRYDFNENDFFIEKVAFFALEK